MAGPVIGLSTFVKLVSQRTEEKLREIAKYERPGGFDRYQFAKEGLTDHIVLGKPLGDVIADLPGSDQNFVDANADVVSAVADWKKKFGGKGIDSPRGIWRSPNDKFSIAIKPEFGVEKGGRRHFVSIYSHGSVRPTATSVGAGLLAASAALRDSLEETDIVCFLDVRLPKLYKKAPNLSQKVLDSEVAFFEAEFEKVRP